MIMIYMIPNIVGAFGMQFLGSQHKIGRLIFYYMTGPYNASMVLLISVLTANTAGHTKKVLTNATLFIGVCVGNIAGPFFYKTSQAPKYELGIWSMILCHILEVLVVFVLRYLLSRENKRRDILQGLDVTVNIEVDDWETRRDLDATAFSDLTDRENLNFR